MYIATIFELKNVLSYMRWFLRVFLFTLFVCETKRNSSWWQGLGVIFNRCRYWPDVIYNLEQYLSLKRSFDVSSRNLVGRSWSFDASSQRFVIRECTANSIRGYWRSRCISYITGTKRDHVLRVDTAKWYWFHPTLCITLIGNLRALRKQNKSNVNTLYSCGKNSLSEKVIPW